MGGGDSDITPAVKEGILMLLGEMLGPAAPNISHYSSRTGPHVFLITT